MQYTDVGEVFYQALSDVTAEWQTLAAAEGIPYYAVPLAAGIWLRWQDDILEVISLSDCRGFYQTTPNGVITPLGILDDTSNDAELTTYITAAQRDGVAPAAMWDKMLPVIRERRAAFNYPNNLNCFSVYPNMARQLTVTRLPLMPGVILLCSDGLFRLVDLYYRYTSKSLMTAVCDNGLSALLTELRSIEDDDADRIKFPRLKGKDDTTALLLRVGLGV